MSEKAMKIEESNSPPAWLQAYINSTEKQQSLYRRTLIIVIIAQIFGGAGLAAGITVGALLAEDMLGTNSFAGLPVALFTLGSAGAAMIVGRLSQRFGRRPGLTIGFVAGSIGAIGVIFAAIINSVILLFASLLVYGAGTATNLQSRYAGTDMANTQQRATAVSMAMVSTTFGAVAGPNLVGVMGNFATSISVPALAGPFILAAAAYILAGLAIFILMRPDPLLVYKALADVQPVDDNSAPGVTLPASWNKRGVIIGATVMILSQITNIFRDRHLTKNLEYHSCRLLKKCTKMKEKRDYMYHCFWRNAAHPWPVPYYLYPQVNPAFSQVRRVKCISPAEVELKSDMRSLWEEHVAWTRMTIISLTFKLPDVDEVITRLLQNATDMGNALRPLYGDKIGDRFGELIKEHLLFAADLVKASLAGDQQAAAEAERKWYANAVEIAIFLSTINPFLTEEAVREMFYKHLDLTKMEAVFMIQMDYKKDIAIYDEIEEQALEMSDAITDAIVKQFPGVFG